MLNHINIMGRMTRDPELRYTGTNTAVCSFTLAVDRDRKGEDGTRATDFIDCVAWKQTAEFVSKYFQKGSLVVVSGRLQFRDWQDREGNNRKSAEVICSDVYFGERKKDEYTPPKGIAFTDIEDYDGEFAGTAELPWE